MTARRKPPADARTLPPRELERLLRQRSYIRPLDAVPPLHVMARRRTLIPGTDSPADPGHQADDTTTTTERQEHGQA